MLAEPPEPLCLGDSKLGLHLAPSKGLPLPLGPCSSRVLRSS